MNRCFKRMIFLLALCACLMPRYALRSQEPPGPPSGRRMSLPLLYLDDSPHMPLTDFKVLLDNAHGDYVVHWDENFGVLRITLGSDVFSLFLGKASLLYNTNVVDVEEPLRVHDGQILIPLSSFKALNRYWKEFAFLDKPEPSPAPTSPPPHPPSPTPESSPERTPVPPTPTPQASAATPAPEIETPHATPTPPTAPLPIPESTPAPVSRRLPPARTGATFRVVLDPAPLPLIAPSSHEPEVSALSAMDVTRDIARRVKRILEQDAALDVVLTFDSGEPQDMNERIARINTSGGDILVAIRLDASEFVSLSGTEIYVVSSSLDTGAVDEAGSAAGSRTRPDNAWRPHEVAGLALAQSIRAEFERTFTEAATAVTPAPLFLLRRAAMPSVLITCGYVTNAEDAALLSREGGRETLSGALAGGILKYREVRTQIPSRRMNR